MASLITNQGLQFAGDRVSATTTIPATNSTIFLQTMVIDDNTTAFASTHTTLNTGAATSNHLAKGFDSTPTRSGQTFSHVTTYATNQFNGNTIRRISLHDRASGSVNATSTTLFGGTDAQSLAKNSTFAVTITMRITNTST